MAILNCCKTNLQSLVTTFLFTSVWVWLPLILILGAIHCHEKRLEENVLELPAVNDPQIAALLEVPNENHHFAKTHDMWWNHFNIPRQYYLLILIVSLWHVDIWPPTLPKHISPWPQRSAHVVAIAIRVTHQNNGQQSRWPWAAMNQSSKTVCWVVMFL